MASWLVQRPKIVIIASALIPIESVELNDDPEVSERNSIGNGITRHFVLASTGFLVIL